MSAIEQGQEAPQLTLGWRLRMAMENAGLTTVDMSDQLEIHRTTIARWVHDEVVPKRIYLREWAALTHVPLEWLEGVEPPKPDARVGAPKAKTAGRQAVTDNNRYVESPRRGRKPARKGANTHSYLELDRGYCGSHLRQYELQAMVRKSKVLTPARAVS